MCLRSLSVQDRLYTPRFNETDTNLSADVIHLQSRGFLMNHFHCGSGVHLGMTRTEVDLFLLADDAESRSSLLRHLPDISHGQGESP
jgi:hypothetical protein